MRANRLTGTAVAVAAVAGAVGVAAWNDAHAEPAGPAQPVIEVVYDPVPDAELLNGVLYIDAYRRFGQPVGFRSVPKSQPPGLTEMQPGFADMPRGDFTLGNRGSSVDGYTFEAAGERIHAFVTVRPGEPQTCTESKDEPPRRCVRDDGEAAVSFTADSRAALATPQAEAARKFWAEVEMVPIDEAGWFADLAARGHAAAVTAG